MFDSKKFNTILLVALCLLLSPFFGCGQAFAASPFDDVSDSHWALPHITKMELREIIAGYGDGTFKPENSVSQLEAAAMAVRAAGMEKEAREVTDTTDAEAFDLPTTWNAAGYVTVAIEEGLIDSDNFQADKNASRAWVAQLTIRMIGTDEEPGSVETHFNDDTEIPYWARDYVALAVDKEIIEGIANEENGYDFQPEGDVTRAQLATMISRSDRYMQEVEGQLPAAEVTSKDGNQFTLAHFDGTTEDFYVSVNAVIFDSSHKKISRDNVAEESLIRYHTDDQDIINFIELLNKDHYPTVPTEEVEEIEGIVVQHFADNRVITIEDNEEKLITHNYSSDLDVDIMEGDEVTLTIKEDTITGIEVISRTETDGAEGEIFSLDLDQGILTLESNNHYQSYKIAEDVNVDYQGVRFPTINDLQKGDKIKVDLENSTIKSITILTLEEDDASTGIIVGTSDKDDVLTIRTQDGRLIAYEVCDQADINIQGISSPSFTDLETDDDISFTVESEKITRIEVKSREYESEITGEVIFISTSSQIISIKDEQENYKTYEIDDYVYLDLDVRDPELRDIYEGMLVTLKLDNNIVQEISLYNKIEGEIEQIDKNRNTIVVKHDQGRTTCRLDDASIRIIDVRRADIDDLKVGQKVLVTLEEDVVDRVEVITEIITTIVEIDTSRERIEVKEGSSTTEYSASSDTTYDIPDISSPEFEDLNEGDVVHLKFVGTTLEEVTVTPPEYGVVISVSEVQNRINLETDVGSETIRVDDDLTVYSSSDNEMTPYNIKENDYVQIIRTDDETMLYQAETVEGEVISVNTSDRRIYITDTDGRYQFYSISEDVKVWKNSTEYLPGDLEEETEVMLYLFDNTAAGIRVK